MNPLHDRLDKLQITGIKLGLDNIRTLLGALQNPEGSFFSILIAGTNGKGSVASMLEQILLSNGYRTGCYTSPHLVDLRERIRVQGELISNEDFEKTVTEVFAKIDDLLSAGKLSVSPTYFETLTAAGMLHFQNKAVDVGVIEVGLGGRYDATNALNQNLTIITTIDYDHQEYLGNTLQQIAIEKAAICKPGIPLVTGSLPDEAISPVHNAVAQNQCDWDRVDPDDVQDLQLVDGFPKFLYRPWNNQIILHLRGKHQASNAAIVLLACEALGRLGILLQREKILQALQTVVWPGRLDLLSNDPPVLLDCAHNPMGVSSLVQYLNDVNWNRVVALFTAMKDKNIPEMFGRISGHVQEVFLTRVEPFERCATQEQLIRSVNFPEERWCHFDDSAEVAYQKAFNRSKELKIPLIIFGSIYLAGKILKFYRGLKSAISDAS